MTVIHARAFICFRFRFFSDSSLLRRIFKPTLFFLQTSLNDSATLFIVNIYQTRQASALRSEYLILDSIFIIKKNILYGKSIFKTQANRRTKRCIFDYRVRVVMTRDN